MPLLLNYSINNRSIIYKNTKCYLSSTIYLQQIGKHVCFLEWSIPFKPIKQFLNWNLYKICKISTHNQYGDPLTRGVAQKLSDFHNVYVTYCFLTSMLSSQDCRLATASSPKARFQITIYRALSVKKHWFTVDMLAGPPMSHTLKDTESSCINRRNKGITH